MALLRHTPWVSQPQVAADIDPSSGFKYAWMANHVGTIPYQKGPNAPFPSVGGLALQLTNTTQSMLATDETISLQGGTFLFYGKALSLNALGEFGILSATPPVTSRCGGHIPFTDGTVYFDFGGATLGSTRVSVAGLTFKESDVFVFTTGSRGMEIWQNGILRASNSANPTRTLASYPFGLGGHQYSGIGVKDLRYKLFAYSPNQIAVEQVKRVSANPWQIFKPIPRRIFVPVSAGGGATITATLGNADATGNTATISAASPVTINAALGTATASGLTATLAQAFNLSANRGTATASGNQATVTQAATISASLATATASGLNASITAAGNVTISCNLGSATASGNQATIGANVTVSASIGAASAAGYTAALDIAYTLAANLGTASATGNTATIFANESIACAIGAALASGYSATVTSTAQLTDSEKIDLILDILSNKQTLDPVSGLYTLYADDGVTVLKTALAWEDSARTIPYRGMSLQALDPME